MKFLVYLQYRWYHLLELAIAHALVTIVTVLIATVLGVGLGVATYRTERPRRIVLSIASVFLTIPSFALFGIMIGFIGLGTVPVVLALVLYSLLPILANTIVGLRGVDPAIVESAKGVGLNRVQRMLRIELPLAWPVIITGMRVSTLITVGIAAIGAYIKGPGLGKDIFFGLTRIGSPQAINYVIGGLAGIIILAILFDLLYVLIARLTTTRGIR
ncbi:MAG TPA: ABC transporter permease [Pseudonocardia sp.]|jgi:osmoprotectant transport system permease protein|nr:ABC transporter permease [Pseudonocardia sp.]